MQNSENEILETDMVEAKEQYMLSLFSSIEKGNKIIFYFQSQIYQQILGNPK